MKKLLIILFTLFSFSLYAQEAELSVETESSGVKASKGGISEIPDSKRPKPIDKEKAEDKDPQYMLKIERLINNSMMYECFPFVDPRAKRTNVYKGLCFCYGFLMILFVEAISNDSSEEDLVDSISSLFRIIDHTAFYYNMSVLYDNAAIMLKL